MLRVTDDRPQRPARPLVGRLALTLLCGCTLLVSAWRFLVREARADAPAAEQAAPFDLSLVAQDKDQDGVYGIRPAAILNRPALAPLRKFINKQIDTYTAPIKATGLGIHIEDVDQVMGRVMLGGEKKRGKRTLMLSLNVMHMTRDMDWAKLRDQCGTLFKKHEWHGETYVSFAPPDFLKGLLGASKGDMYLWAADARTLIQDSEAIIQKQIDAKAAGKKLPVPAYAAGWDTVSRGLFAIALDNRGSRLVKRCMTDEERQLALLANPIELCQEVVAGCTGDDDVRFDLHLTAADADAAAKVAEHCKGVLAWARDVRGVMRASARTDEGAANAGLALLLRCAEGATVRKNGATVTVHAEVAAGLNALLAAYAKELTTSEK